jgi:hypothetical protein
MQDAHDLDRCAGDAIVEAMAADRQPPIAALTCELSIPESGKWRRRSTAASISSR